MGRWYEQRETKLEHVPIKTSCIIFTGHLAKYNKTLIWDEDESMEVWL